MKYRTLQRGSARMNLIVVLGIAGLAAILLLLTLTQQSPQEATNEFMEALATKNVNRLAEMSYLESPRTPLKEQWDVAVNERAKNFVFIWHFESSRQPSPEEAVVRLTLVEFRGPEPKDSEPYEIPLLKRDGQWKVDLASLTRKFFPALPR
ncbi:MAG: hypothetical protein H0W86_01850 [Armatimonadetes bacterium]|nr:hypothetical protein [Armatimonadota bacterium]